MDLFQQFYCRKWRTRNSAFIGVYQNLFSFYRPRSVILFTSWGLSRIQKSSVGRHLQNDTLARSTTESFWPTISNMSFKSSLVSKLPIVAMLVDKLTIRCSSLYYNTILIVIRGVPSSQFLVINDDKNSAEITAFLAVPWPLAPFWTTSVLCASNLSWWRSLVPADSDLLIVGIILIHCFCCYINVWDELIGPFQWPMFVYDN